MTKETREFEARLLDWAEIHELPDGWPAPRLLSLLARLEVEGVSEADAPDMSLMALQDLEPDDAAEVVLEEVFGESMRAGVRQNLAHDLREERPWEEFADVAHQAGIFNAVVLLQRAFPRDHDKPDAVSITVRVTTDSEKGRGWLQAPVPDPALLMRILAGGMDDRAVLRRLFGDSLGGSSFAEARGIAWKVLPREGAPPAFEFTLISSHQWFDPLRDAESWTVMAQPDRGTENPL